MNQTLLGNGIIGGDWQDVHSPPQVTAWNISKIEDTNTGKSIQFYYIDSHSNPNPNLETSPIKQKSAQRIFELDETPAISIQPGGCSYFTPSPNLSKSWDEKIIARVDVQKKVLSRIVFQEGEIKFNYNHEGIGGPGISRPDVYNGYFVTQIYLKDKNQKNVKSFELNYSTFDSDYNVGEFNPDGEFNGYRYKRLKLLSFGETGTPPYKFFYDESIKLPPVNSFSIDFLGYFNNSPDIKKTSDLSNTVRPNPTLYYYPNQFDKSLLPFPIPGKTYTTIPGIFNREANDYARAWSLNKIEYPTGGSSEYFYESNEFEIFGTTVKGGGIRIQKQILKDGLGGAREIQYEYKKATGETSGILPRFPYFGHPTTAFFTVTIGSPAYDITSPTPNSTTLNKDDWKFYDKGRLNADITTGSYVGYSRVLEKETNNGYKELIFTSGNNPLFADKLHRVDPHLSQDIYSMDVGSTCIVDFVITNSGFGSEIFTDNSYKRGKLLEETIFDSFNNKLKKTELNYTEFNLTSTNFAQGFYQPKYTQNDNNNLKTFMTVEKDYKVAQYLQTTEKISVYDKTGNEQKTQVTFTYNPNGLVKTINTTNSNGIVHKSQYYYPTDATSTTSLSSTPLTADELTAYQGLTSLVRNNLAQQIQVEEYQNGIKNSTLRSTFKYQNPSPNSGLILPLTIKKSKDNEPLSNQFTITQYEADIDNPVEIYQENGTKSVMIWGYNKSKLIAKLDNIDFATISPSVISNLQSLSDQDFDNCRNSTCKQEQLRIALNNLRTTYPQAMITTYTYDPLVGITSSTDPRGEAVYFEYDEFNRLKRTLDYQGNILTENNYNYKN